MYGEMEDNIKVLLLLKELLSGNREICYNILQMKIQKERDEIFLESQDFWIENNFYNWLNHDIVLRKELKLQLLEHNGMVYSTYYEYYKINEGILGLRELKRKRGLNECFNSPWWKCTMKATIPWNNIHIMINSNIRVYSVNEGFYEEGVNIEYYFIHNLLIELFGLERIKYIDKAYNMMVDHGASFEDIDIIFIGNSEIQFIE